MKAYSVTDANGYCNYSYIVFAETRAKAIRYALDHCDGCFDSFEWIEMRALRRPTLDKYFNGRYEMDWCNDDDRVAMVKDAGYECSDEDDVTIEECENCPAHEWCDRYDRKYFIHQAMKQYAAGLRHEQLRLVQRKLSMKEQ